MKQTEQIDTFLRMAQLFPRMIHGIIRNLDSPTGSDLGLNQTQVKVLMLLYHKDYSTMRELCEHVDVQKSSMTSIIDSLEEGSFVERVRREHDRRSYLVRLTASGRQAAADFRKEVRSRFDKQIARLSSEDREAFGQALETLTAMIEKMEKEEDE